MCIYSAHDSQSPMNVMISAVRSADKCRANSARAQAGPCVRDMKVSLIENFYWTTREERGVG